MQTEIKKARDARKKRNAESLKKISGLCKARLDKMLEDYDIRTEERNKITDGAQQFLDKLMDEGVKNKAGLASACRDQIRDINSDKLSLFNESIERDFAEIPVDISFVRIVDSSFRKDAPAGTEANYHRDRGWDFAEVASNFKSLKIGKIHSSSF